MSGKKLILVIGATGAQGRPVVSSLLAPQDDGSASPYSVRALTRDPTSKEAQYLASLGAELFTGRFDDLDSIVAACEGCYGAFVNINTFNIGQQGEIHFGIKMFEQAHRSRMKHFVWSGLDYGSKLGNYQLKYKANHFDAKGIVTDFLKSQFSVPNGDSLTWSVVITGPYIENLSGVISGPLLAPLAERENGAVVFALPTGDGHIPIISLEDIGWWARYTFDHRAETSGQELKIATEMMTMDQLAETFTRVTGIPAIHKRLSVDEYMNLYPWLDKVALPGQGTMGENFRGMYNCWRDDLLTRDIEWNRAIHPGGYTLESWIRKTGYNADVKEKSGALTSL
ncbi:NAD(P)-binding protein [Rhodocollybia butyracea]|uniref:NAD(P)-binding protein n=1 Tax=Rhodocollybia butyracea TaxID=206335 RepID=A0A9P5PSA9_9AGAR|nr:NAD(P)-binding protein [Rhodocollybia butyracea]